jgi:hypothetical protein
MRTVITLILLLASAPAHANVIYSYVGTPFTDIVDVPFPGGTFDISMGITGAFELASPLPANLPMTDIAADVLSFTFSNGRDTVTELSPEVTTFFYVKTNGAGLLTDWFLIVDQTSRADLADPQVSIFVWNDPQGLALGTQLVLDQGTLAMCDPALIPRGLCITLADQASVANRPGTWSSSTPPNVPEPASAAFLTVALLAAGVRAKRGRTP